MSTTILGIRHHGPGSAYKVQQYLAKHPPDIILIEGPPEAESILPFAAQTTMQPPVAMLVYDPKDPRIASFYPFAAFSPEWQAIQFGLANDIPIRFMDMPMTHHLAFSKQERDALLEAETEKEDVVLEPETESEVAEPVLIAEPEKPIYPLDYLAQIAGYDNTDLWWEHQFELHSEVEAHFDAVLEAMTALRETDLDYKPEQEDIREAFMRRIVAKAEAEYEKVTVICGAWHGPALVSRPTKKADNEILKGLPKSTVALTWIPWTYERLAFESGYGAGVFSPGWYAHVWDTFDGERSQSWMIKVAQVLRNHQMDTSTAHVIEAVRLANHLAALRGLSQPGLGEFNDATINVLSDGEDHLLQLVRKELIVGNVFGQVPDEAPTVPLQQDLQAQQKTLRLKVSDEYKVMVLDLRKDLDLRRSMFFHRLAILEINWAEKTYVSGTGTFKEQWTLHWEPAWILKVIEMAVWGNTIAQASDAFARDLGSKTQTLAETVSLLNKALPAGLHETVQFLIQKVDAQAAVSGDVLQLLEALPSLINVARYGDVRQTDVGILGEVLDSIISRVNIGLPNACMSLDEDTAQATLERVGKVDAALHVYQNEEHLQAWYACLKMLTDSAQTAPAVAGKACRLLSDHRIMDKATISSYLSRALSYGQDLAFSAYWLEGFLYGSSVIFLLEDEVWEVLNDWVANMEEADFIHYLPVIRRSFSLFNQAERRKIGEQAKRKGSRSSSPNKLQSTTFNHERGMKATDVIAQLLQLNGR